MQIKTLLSLPSLPLSSSNEAEETSSATIIVICEAKICQYFNEISQVQIFFLTTTTTTTTAIYLSIFIQNLLIIIIINQKLYLQKQEKENGKIFQGNQFIDNHQRYRRSIEL
ncbi:hypothetical protein DERP_009947 [Dermatophagoides pteronyssinus]|uniref:Transmembrane protein n=1 Tax=Dermatophagoides pteronyssinus TaxID=6956 RepID=A0ABQ8J1Y8_DERPT|nr:hypothetical protein DERP_009947 [Dermatophagoides pteronyssinus]